MLAGCQMYVALYIGKLSDVGCLVYRHVAQHIVNTWTLSAVRISSVHHDGYGLINRLTWQV